MRFLHDKRQLSANVLEVTDRGLYCAAGNFYVDPWQPVEHAVVTHAHGDHLTWGCDRYLVTNDGEAITRLRLGEWARGVTSLPYGETRSLNGVQVSFHPAGHILGSAQVRLEYRGEVWVVSGDYKLDADSTCAPFESVTCHTFVTESTFGLPIYQWTDPALIYADINAWWTENAELGHTSFLFGYALGKAQRLLAGLDASIGPILTHGAVGRITDLYREAGIALPPTQHAVSKSGKESGRAIVIAPPSASGSTWARKFGTSAHAFASGWMRVRGARRRRGVDRGFPLSDHVDWPQLLRAIGATRAERVWVTHGFTGPVVRWLTDQGLDARAIPTRYEGEREDVTVDADDSTTVEAQDTATIDSSPV